MTGAAMLYDANGKFRRVKLANGQNQVEVILRNSYRDTQLSWGIWGFSWTFKATNYAERLVDAVPRRGSVSGSPWNRQPVSTSSLRVKCTQIEKEQEAKEKAANADGRVIEPWTEKYRHLLSKWEKAANRWLSIYDGS
jgi:hypothetical protein